MDKMRMESVDMTAQNIDRIGELFPNCITETRDENGKLKKAINFEMLRQMLSSDIAEGDEAYEFTWVGKKASIVEANKPIRKTLRPCPEESVDWDKTENLYIEGDNLEVLKLLQESYLGKVKMIYIDPPYNTGHDFVYPDSFIMDNEEYNEGTGYFDEDGNVNYKRENPSTAGKYHSDWCSMIYSRLLLARNLLTYDGLIFISIDDNEYENLKKICDEVFGEDNYINVICLKTKATSGASGGGEDKRLKKNTEYVLLYSKSRADFDMSSPIEYVRISDFISEHKENKIGFYYTRILEDEGSRRLVKEVGDIKIYEHENFKFSSVSEKMNQEKLTLDEVYSKYFDKIFMVTNAQTSILTRVNDIIKDSQKLLSYDYVPQSGKDKGQEVTKYVWNKTLVVWFSDSAIKENNFVFKANQKGTLWDDISWGRLDLQGNVSFKNGKKPLKLLERVISMCTSSKDIILDFFSGSATTAHAVMDMNARDNQKRRFMLVQLPEPCEDKYPEFENICEIGKERIRRAGAKIKEEMKQNSTLHSPNSTLDTGFRVFKLDDSNMNDVYYSPAEYNQGKLKDLESNIKSDRTDLDLLFGCLLDWGLPLSMPYTSEKIDGFTVHTYNDGDLIACFDENVPESVIKEIAKRKPLRAVFRDSSFENSPAKINVGEIFKLLAPDTRVKVI